MWYFTSRVFYSLIWFNPIWRIFHLIYPQVTNQKGSRTPCWCWALTQTGRETRRRAWLIFIFSLFMGYETASQFSARFLCGFCHYFVMNNDLERRAHPRWPGSSKILNSSFNIIFEPLLFLVKWTLYVKETVTLYLRWWQCSTFLLLIREEDRGWE